MNVISLKEIVECNALLKDKMNFWLAEESGRQS